MVVRHIIFTLIRLLGRGLKRHAMLAKRITKDRKQLTRLLIIANNRTAKFT
jgi:hypothetical protein